MASKRRITIQQASDELAALGYELRPQPVKHDFKAKKTYYAVVGPDGNIRVMSGAEIADFIEQQKQA